MNQKKIILLVLLITFNLAGQDLKGTWLFNDHKIFISGEDGIKSSELFNFFEGYSVFNDTLIIKHVYPKSECFKYENEIRVEIPCTDNSTPDSWYEITKLTPDSLYLRPINRAAIAISARLKHKFLDLSKKIISDSLYNPDYFEIIKLHSPKKLYEDIKWSKIQISSKTNSWHQEYFDYFEIYSDGTFNAFKKIEPFEKGKPTEEYVKRTTYYQDTLTANELNELNQNINKSGFYHFEIERQGWSSHGSLIKIKIFSDNKTKTHIGYQHMYPHISKALLQRLLSIVNEEETNQTKKRFKVPTDFRL